MERTQPPRTAFTEPWFTACREGRLTIQRCEACGHHQFYPRVLCVRCSAASPAWVIASGAARVVSFTVVRRPVSKAYEAPYIVALVELAEGPRMMTNVVGCAPDEVRIDMRVSVSFESWSEDVSLPVFVAVNKPEEERAS